MTAHDTDADEATRIRERLARLAAEREELEARLAEIEPGVPVETVGGSLPITVTDRSTVADKIALFRSLFHGRDDVYPKRWENTRTGKAGYAPVCANEWKPRLCEKPRIKCGMCPNQAFLAVTDDAIDAHLRGRQTLGVYPMLPDGTCRFIAADFDKATWQTDAGAFLAVCRSKQVPAALERSRSGNGGHVWIFFSEPVPAALARRLGSHLLTEAMESAPDIGFKSYDRFFPSQDTLPDGGFGNLIALPLQVGGGKRKPGGIVDVATLQSLERGNIVDDIVGDYGHLVVDECHHLSAVSFEAVARRAKARYVLGLSATVTRKDGHHPIVFMQCGPVRFRATAKAEARRHPFRHRAILRPTRFRLPAGIDAERPPIQQVYAALADDEDRNALIFDDVLAALEARRSPILLTERKEHAHRLAERLGRFARNVLLLRGGMGARQRREVMQRLEDIPDGEERVLVATGRYIGEGFDDARLDTLFLAMPVSWRGTLAQYVGRLHRRHPEKREVLVYDYLDDAVPVLSRMGSKRIKGYESLGYTVERPGIPTLT